MDKIKIRSERVKTSTAFLRLASVKSGLPSSLDIFIISHFALFVNRKMRKNLDFIGIFSLFCCRFSRGFCPLRASSLICFLAQNQHRTPRKPAPERAHQVPQPRSSEPSPAPLASANPQRAPPTARSFRAVQRQRPAHIRTRSHAPARAYYLYIYYIFIAFPRVCARPRAYMRTHARPRARPHPCARVFIYFPLFMIYCFPYPHYLRFISRSSLLFMIYSPLCMIYLS